MRISETQDIQIMDDFEEFIKNIYEKGFKKDQISDLYGYIHELTRMPIAALESHEEMLRQTAFYLNDLTDCNFHAEEIELLLVDPYKYNSESFFSKNAHLKADKSNMELNRVIRELLKKTRTQLQGNYVLMSLSKDMIKWFMQEHFALHDKIKKMEEQKEIEKLKARLKQEEKELSPEPNIEPEKEEKVNETIGEVIELTDFYVTGKEEKEKVEKIDIEINSEENNELDPFEEMQKQEEKEINLAHLKKYGDKKLKSMPDNREIKVHD